MHSNWVKEDAHGELHLAEKDVAETSLETRKSDERIC
jgi:hypothetical protein